MTIELITKKDLIEQAERLIQTMKELNMPQQKTLPLLKPKQVMEELNCSYGSLQELIAEGLLVPIRLLDQNRFRAEDVERIKQGF